MTAPTPRRPTTARHVTEYGSVQARATEFVRDSDAEQRVPACPGWAVRDVLSHLLGVCEDWQRGRFDRYASEAWTAAHVARHEGAAPGELLDAWGRCLEGFAAVTSSPFGGTPGRWAFGDAIIHEADLRGALGIGPMPEEPLHLALVGMMARWHDLLRQATCLRIQVRSADGGEWLVGTADTAGTDADARAVLELEVTAHELFRGLAGRRTREQVRAWRWSDDPEPVLEAGLPYPFRWASLPLED
jgi:uncharacterized protein (TIGR03083 family)